MVQNPGQTSKVPDSPILDFGLPIFGFSSNPKSKNQKSKIDSLLRGQCWIRTKLPLHRLPSL
jgi:hypothetical protein